MNKYYIYGVNFKDNGKVYKFKSQVKCPLNVTVITETEKGEQFGKVVSFIEESNIKSIDELKEIVRISTKKDYEQHLKNLRDAEKALRECRNIVKELNLDMKVINANYTFDRKQLIFNFLADERVDFRELAKKLASIYRTRIELRQIGARDKAREIGGLGACGGKICCSRFLSHIDSVSMTMAKNQGLALNPSKINGICGRLLCCLTYEDDNYLECNKGMPEIGEYVETEKGKGQVISKDILNRTYKVLINNEKIDISLGDLNGIVKNDVYDYGLKIFQDSEKFKFSLDSLLLAEFVEIKKSDKKIIDFCSGNAPLPLILSAKYNKEISGIEIQKEVYDLACKSIKENKLGESSYNV